MTRNHTTVSRGRKTLAVSLLVTCIAPGGVLLAQSLHPFAAPTPVEFVNMSPATGVLDINRDGSPDLIAQLLFFGLYFTTLDEDGTALSTIVQGPALSTPPGVAFLAMAIALAGGDIDGDELEDLLCVSSTGSVHFLRNLGSTSLASSNFAADVVIDNFLTAFPVNPPFVNYVFPVAQVCDLDGDGIQDLLIAGGPNDRWTATAVPGFVGFYKGDGAGGFQVDRLALTGSVIDMELVDIDNDGARDDLVVLTETGSYGAFTNDIVHIELSNGSLAAVGYPQNVGPGRLTALEIADVIGDADLDYIVAQTSPSGGLTPAEVYFFEGDGQGHVIGSSWGTFSLPPNLTGIGDFISSIQVGDFNRDQHIDIAVLRGFVQGPQFSTTNQPTYSDCEILIASGPSLAYAPFEIIPLPGHIMFSSINSQLFSLLPLSAQPDELHTIDLGRDSSTDLMVTSLRPADPASAEWTVTLKNMTPPAPGDARFEKVGEPSGGVPSHPARIGFEGGRPRPGNASFACTIQNVQGGCLVGLMWGSYGMANLFSTFGLDFHLAPTECGYAAITSGSLPGKGFYSYPLPIPNQPTLIGDAGYFQYNYYDHEAAVFGGTQATGVWIGN